MKPVLKGITISDIELYKSAIQKYDIKNVVVGSLFEEKETGETVPFSNKNILFYNPISDESSIKKELKEIKGLKVFSRSSQVMKYYKENYC